MLPIRFGNSWVKILCLRIRNCMILFLAAAESVMFCLADDSEESTKMLL